MDLKNSFQSICIRLNKQSNSMENLHAIKCVFLNKTNTTILTTMIWSDRIFFLVRFVICLRVLSKIKSYFCKSSSVSNKTNKMFIPIMIPDTSLELILPVKSHNIINYKVKDLLQSLSLNTSLMSSSIKIYSLDKITSDKPLIIKPFSRNRRKL